MLVVKLTRKDLQKLWKIPYIFKDKFATREYLRSFFFDTGISTRYLEYMLWQLDTLFVLSRFATNLVWKGGTCIQSYLPQKFQRFSIDIDINTQLDRKSLRRLFVETINKSIQKDNKEEIVESVPFGTFYVHSEDTQIGSMNFSRIVPTKHSGEIIFRGNIKVIGAIQIRVQVNYKLSERLGFIAQEVLKKKPELVPSEIITREFQFPHESVSDLIADKIVTMAEIPGFHRGRLRIKDTYDLVALLMTKKYKINMILRKLDAYATAWKTSVNDILDATRNELEKIKNMDIEALGLKGSVGTEGFTEIILKWKNTTKKIQKFLEGLLNAS